MGLFSDKPGYKASGGPVGGDRKKWTSAGGFKAAATTAKEAILKRKANRTAKQEARKERRSLKKEYRVKGRTAAKKIRSENKPGKARAKLMGASRAFHKVDKEGKVGGFAAFGKYSQKETAKATKKEARVAKKTERKDARVAKRTARKESRNA